MPRINAIEITEATGKAKGLLEGVQAQLGTVPNLMKTLAHSPAVLEAALSFTTLLGSTLDAKLREQIAILTAETNGCGYCLSAHTYFGGKAGLSGDELTAAREARSADVKSDAALTFARSVLEKRGSVSDADLEAIRAAGFDDAGVSEIVANVVLNVFTNYFNQVAQTEIDFPKVEPFQKAAARS